nr:site-specific integrase [Streptomyces sp. SID9124]
MSLETVDLYISTIERLLRFAGAHDVTRIDDVTHTLALAFIEAPGRNRHQCLILNTSNGTRRQRRSALESFFTEARALGLTKATPLVDLPPIPRDPRKPGTRLSDDEIQRLKFQAERGMPATRHATILALLLAGQSTAEIAKATTDDLDLAESSVWTDGATRTYGRVCPLTPWGLGVIELRADHLLRTTPRPDERQPLTTGATSAYRAQASVCTGFGDIARRSGLATARRRVEPKDVTRYVARTILSETGQLSEVARRLGLSSLDGAAALADLNWQPEDGQDGGEAA